MPTWRDFTKRAYQCSFYEAQDVLTEIDDVDLIRLRPGNHFGFREKWQRRLVYRDASHRLVFANPGLERVSLTQDYDLFVAVCQNHWDLLYVNAIDGWKERCRTSVVWLDEMWAEDVDICRHWLPALSRFDHVFVAYRGTVDLLSRALNRPCHWLPTAVDVRRFTPYPTPPARSIDVYSIGRRWEGIHQALLQAADRREIFYIYDTFPAMANLEPYDFRQHRDVLANIAKRSRFFMVAPGKMNRTEETHGQVELGYRYYEAIAAGAVMIGQAADTPAFRESFGWADAVIPIASDGSDAISIIRGLKAEPDRLAASSRRNAAEALGRHDWMHRWKEILRVAGLPSGPALIARERHLADLAALAQSRDVAGVRP